jgi:hypothetical protein
VIRKLVPRVLLECPDAEQFLRAARSHPPRAVALLGQGARVAPAAVSNRTWLSRVFVRVSQAEAVSIGVFAHGKL